MNTDRFKTTLPTAAQMEQFTPEQAREVRKTLEDFNPTYRAGMLHGDQMQNWTAAKDASAVLSKLVEREHQPTTEAQRHATMVKAHPFTAEQMGEARVQISQMKSNPQFMEAFSNPMATGHKQARDAWEASFEIAHPGLDVQVGFSEQPQ